MNKERDILLSGFASSATAGGNGAKMKLMKSKRGVIDQLQPLVIALVAIGITLAVSFLILAELASNAKVVADTNATVAVRETTSAMADIPGWLPIVVVTVIGALLIALIAIFRRR